MGNRARGAAAAIAVALVASACSALVDRDDTNQAIDHGPPRAGGRLIFAIEAETGGLNPTADRFAISGHLVASAVFDPLTAVDADGVVQPHLAESVEPNDDYTRWTIRLRSGISFHDGTTLGADLVKANLEAHRQSVLTAAVLRPISSIEVVDDVTVVVGLSQPWVTFPYQLSTQVGYVAAASMLDDPEASANPVGTGPFVFSEWVPDERWVVERNPDYWRDGHPLVDAIEFRVITDPQQRAAALDGGDVDMIHTSREEDVQRFRDRSFVQVEDDSGEASFVMLNTAAKPFHNPIAREALARAPDQQRLIDVLGAGVLRPTSAPFAPGSPWAPENDGYPAYDLDRAQALVAQYEAETGEQLAFTYLGTPTPESLAIQQFVQSMWREAGIEANIVTEPQEDLIVDAVTGQFQATQWRLFGAPDPDGEYTWWHSSNVAPVGEISLNFARLEDAELDAALDLGRTSADTDVRRDAYQTAVRRINANLPYIWLNQTLWAVAGRNLVQGLEHAADGGLATLDSKTFLADVWIAEP